jgi:hypothetical protein
MPGQILLEPLCDPVVLPEEDDVHRGEERVLVHPHVAGHKVLGPLGAEVARVGAQVKLLAGRELQERRGGDKVEVKSQIRNNI